MQGSVHQLQPDGGRGAGVHDQVLHLPDPSGEEHPRAASDQRRRVETKICPGSGCEHFEGRELKRKSDGSVSSEETEEQHHRLLRNLHPRGGRGGQAVLVEQSDWKGFRNCGSVDDNCSTVGDGLHGNPDHQHQPEHPAVDYCHRADHHRHHPVPEGSSYSHGLHHRHLPDNYNDTAT